MDIMKDKDDEDENRYQNFFEIIQPDLSQEFN